MTKLRRRGSCLPLGGRQNWDSADGLPQWSNVAPPSAFAFQRFPARVRGFEVRLGVGQFAL
jgi:hypothetical protein